MPRRGLKVLAATITGAAVAATAATQVAGRDEIRKGPAASASDPAATAHVLVDRVSAASSYEARFNAVLKIFEALNIGVYSARGEHAVAGSEHGADALYVYDFESSILAGSLSKRQSLAEIARALPRSAKGTRPTAAALAKALRRGTRAALEANDAFSLGPILIRELGLRHRAPFDTTRSLNTNLRLFDPLQVFILTTEILSRAYPDQLDPSLAGSTTKREAAWARKQAGGGPKTECGDFASNARTKKFLPLGKWIVGLLPYSTEVTYSLNPLYSHAFILRLLFRVSAGPSQLDAHYGPATRDHEGRFLPRTSLKFDVRVFADYSLIPYLMAYRGVDLDFTPAQWERYFVECGQLAGVKFPQAGPVENVAVWWGDEGVLSIGRARLKKHASGEVPEYSNTGEDGEAILEVPLKRECHPGEGRELVEGGSLFTKVDYLSAMESTLGGVLEEVFPMPAPTLNFTVAYHHSDRNGSCDSVTRWEAAISGVVRIPEDGGVTIHSEAHATFVLDKTGFGWTEFRPLPGGTVTYHIEYDGSGDGCSNESATVTRKIGITDSEFRLWTGAGRRNDYSGGGRPSGERVVTLTTNCGPCGPDPECSRPYVNEVPVPLPTWWDTGTEQRRRPGEVNIRGTYHRTDGEGWESEWTWQLNRG